MDLIHLFISQWIFLIIMVSMVHLLGEGRKLGVNRCWVRLLPGVTGDGLKEKN